MSEHRSHPDLLMARALGVCWHSPTSDRWPCQAATSLRPVDSGGRRRGTASEGEGRG